MYIWEYDICEGDKGIIIAYSKKEAVQIFQNSYPDISVTGRSERGECIIALISKLDDEPKLYYMYS